jgi:hypothetical protein
MILQLVQGKIPSLKLGCLLAMDEFIYRENCLVFRRDTFRRRGGSTFFPDTVARRLTMTTP